MRSIVFTNLNNTISVLYEFKPPNGKGPGVLSCLCIRNKKNVVVFEPSNSKSCKTGDVLASEIAIQLQNAPWKNANILTALKRLLGGVPMSVIEEAVAHLDVFAVVTGNIRSEYFRKKNAPLDQEAMDFAVGQVMGAVGAKPFSEMFAKNSKTCFISEEQEGCMELLGMRSMYKQINVRLQNMHLSSEQLEPIVSLGIGQTSAQWAAVNRPQQNDPYEFSVFAYNNGMNVAMRLANFPTALVNHYDTAVTPEEGSLASLVHVIEKCKRNNGCPVIGLKSGAALFFTTRAEGASLRRLFTELPQELGSEEIRVFYVFEKQKRAGILNRGWSIARLCAEVQHRLQTASVLENVSYLGAPLLFLVGLPPNAILEFATETPNVTWWPDEDSRIAIQIPAFLGNEFDLEMTPEMLFYHIFVQYLATHEATSYPCIASVYKLLWSDNLNQTNPKALLERAEQWFRGVTAIADLPKLKALQTLQNIPSAVKQLASAWDHAECKQDAVRSGCFPLLTDVSEKEFKETLYTMERIWFCRIGVMGVDVVTNDHVQQVKTALERAFYEPVTVLSATWEKHTCLMRVRCGDHTYYTFLVVPNQKRENMVASSSSSELFYVPSTLISTEQPTAHYIDAHNYRLLEDCIQQQAGLSLLCQSSLLRVRATKQLQVSPNQSVHTALLEQLTVDYGIATMDVYHVAGTDRVRALCCIKPEQQESETKSICFLVEIDLGPFRDTIRPDVVDRLLRLDKTQPDLLPSKSVYAQVATAPRKSILVALTSFDNPDRRDGLPMHMLGRLLQLMHTIPGIRILHCADRLRVDAGYGDATVATLLVADCSCDRVVPLLFQVHVLIQSELSFLYQDIRQLQRTSDLYEPFLRKRANMFFPLGTTVHPAPLHQEPNDWVMLHRTALALFHGFQGAMKRASAALHKEGLPVRMCVNTKSESSLKRKIKTETGLQTRIVPFSFVQESSRSIEPETDEDEGAVNAWLTTCSTLQRLWDYPNERWQQELKYKLRIGFVKSSEKEGNTSVAFGCATQIADFGDWQAVGFLNFGTTSTKFQLVTNEPLLHMASEKKVDHNTAHSCNMHLLTFGKYEPADGLTARQLQSRLYNLRAEYPWNDLEKGTYGVYAFVTGPLRDHWATCDAEQKSLLEEKVSMVMALADALRLPFNNHSWFLTPETEAKLELCAAQRMYANLQKNNQLSEQYSVIGCMGIGGGGSKVALEDGPVFACAVGMKHTRQKLQSDWEEGLFHAFQQNEERAFIAFMDVVERSTLPVFALKSGCLVWINRHPKAMETITSAASFLYDYLRGTLTLPKQGLTDIRTELRATLQAIHKYIGPIVRIKDNSKLGFLLINVLFSQPRDSKKTKPGEHKSQSMVCEIQIRCEGQPDDHAIYECRRNLQIKDGDTRSIQHMLRDFFTDQCQHAFRLPNDTTSITILQDNGQLRVAALP